MPNEPAAATLDAPAAGEKAPADFMADAMTDFAEMDAAPPPASKPKPAAPAKPAAKPEPTPRDDKGKFAKQTDDKSTSRPTGETQVDHPIQPVPEGEGKPEDAKPTRLRELGERYDTLKKQIDTEYKPQITKLQSRIQELEAVDPKPLQDRLAALEARNKSLEEQIEYSDYSQSTEFKTKYHDPYAKAYHEALGEFKELGVREADGEIRPATEKDLLELANMPLGRMDETAQQMFGASAARVITHIQNLKHLAQAEHSALEEAKTKAGERLTKRRAESESQMREAADHWRAVNDGLKEKFPKAFAPEDGNAEDAAAHTKGFALADLLFTGGKGLTPEQIETLPNAFRETVRKKEPLSPVQRVQLHALLRLKAANHDRKVVALQKANARIAELEKALAEFEKSSPPGGRAKGADGGGGDGGDGFMTVEKAEADFRAMDK